MIRGVILAAALLQAAVPMHIVEQGSQSFIEARKEVVARTQAEFDAVWKMHAPNRPAPTVDFSRDMVVGLFLGTRNTAGYTVDVLDVTEGSTGVVVRFSEKQPPKAAVLAQVITSPYVLVAVPTAPGEVRFQKAE